MLKSKPVGRISGGVMVEMGNEGRKLVSILLLAALVIGLGLLCSGVQLVYSLYTLSWARASGVYETPEQGILAMIEDQYCDVERVDFEHVGPDSSDGANPHIWYVVWEVHAQHRAPCDPVHPGPPLHFGTYEGGGSYFLDTTDGWIYLPEGRFPGVVGYWMKVLGQAGPGERVHVKGE